MVRGQSWIVLISMISKAIVYFLFHLLGNNSRWFLNHWLFIFTSRGLTLWASGGEKLWLRHFITVTRKTSRTKWRPTCLVLSPTCKQASGQKISASLLYEEINSRGSWIWKLQHRKLWERKLRLESRERINFTILPKKQVLDVIFWL